MGAAAFIAGSITGGIAMTKDGVLEEKCEEDGCYSTEYGIMESRDKLAVSSTVLFAAGGTVAAAGIVMIIVSRVQKKKTSEASVSLAPNGLLVWGEF